MNRVRVVPGASSEAVLTVALDMRADDVREVWASSRSRPFDAVAKSVALSRDVWTGYVDERPAAIFGIGSTDILSGVGVPWLLGTDRMGDAAREVLRVSRMAVRDLRQRYPVMRNFVDVRNTASRRWLRWLGFTESAPVPFGPDGLPFCLFELRG